MVIINNVNGSTFSLNGTRYIKNFMIIKQGSTNVAIHNAYDTKYQLLSSTHYSQINVNNQVYTNQADLMAALAPVLFANSFIGGNVTSTSQLLNDGSDGINPFVTTADLPSANKIVNQTGYGLIGETLTINPEWVWLIANQQYYNVGEVELTIPLAANGMTRIDLIVATTGSTFERIEGVEAEDNAIAPPLPNNTIQATLIVVTDGIEPIVVEPTPTGDLYLQKADEKIATISSNGIISNFGLKNYTNYYIKETSSISQINGASFLASSISYDGKRVRFINKQSTPITFIHNGGTGTLKFDLVNGLNFVLKSNETISFIVKDGDKLLQIKESTSSAIPTLEQVTTAGNNVTDKYINFYSNIDFNNSGGMNHKNIYFSDNSGIYSKLTSLTPNGLSYLSSQYGSVTNVTFSAATQSNTIYFPNASGTLALLSDVQSSNNNVWKTSDLTTNATNNTQNVYRQGSSNLVGSNKFFSTGPTVSDIDGEILGTNFGHITGGGGTIPFIQLLSNSGNGSAGTNHFIGRYVGAGVSNPQMNFSAIKSTSYDAWGDAGRVLFRFNDGYLAPQSKLDIGTDYIKFTTYPSTRNDTGSTVSNLLFTDTTGVLKSKPIGNVLESRNGSNNYFSDFIEQGDFRVNNAGYNAAQVYYGGTVNVNHPGQITHYLDNITSIGLTFINFGHKEPNQILDFVYLVDTTQPYLNSTIGCGIDTGVVANDNAYYFHIIGNTISAVTSRNGTKTSVTLGNLASGDINNGTYYHYRISVLTTNSIKFDVYQMNGNLLFTTTISTNIVDDLTNNMPIGVKTFITSGTPSITPVYMARYDYVSIKYNNIKQRGAI
jgi:hypothetical protein